MNEYLVTDGQATQPAIYFTLPIRQPTKWPLAQQALSC